MPVFVTNRQDALEYKDPANQGRSRRPHSAPLRRAQDLHKEADRQQDDEDDPKGEAQFAGIIRDGPLREVPRGARLLPSAMLAPRIAEEIGPRTGQKGDDG